MPAKPVKDTKTVLDAKRGTAVWGMNALRSDALTHLLDDLVDLEKFGLSDENCDEVRRALEKLANRASELPDGSFWMTSVHSEIESFVEVYRRWNSSGPGPESEKQLHRVACVKDLRSVRQRISKRIRQNQYVIQHELDLKFVEDMYGALGGLVSALPETFKGLAKSMSRFEERKKTS